MLNGNQRRIASRAAEPADHHQRRNRTGNQSAARPRVSFIPKGGQYSARTRQIISIEVITMAATLLAKNCTAMRAPTDPPAPSDPANQHTKNTGHSAIKPALSPACIRQIVASAKITAANTIHTSGELKPWPQSCCCTYPRKRSLRPVTCTS